MLDINSEAIKRTTSAYNKIAIEYSKCWSNDTCMHSRLRKFLTYLPEKPLVVDIGCGTGRDMKFLSEQGAHTIGIDLSIEMLNEAKRITFGGKFLLMDMRNLGFPSNVFNGIWASASVLHIPKCHIEDVLQEFYRILKKDGVLFLCLQEGEHESFVEDGRFYAYYKREEIRAVLQKRNFQILDFDFNESRRNTFNKSIVVKWISFWARKNN